MESARKKLVIDVNEWAHEGFRLFGTKDSGYWEFICPACGIITQVDECRRLEIPTPVIAKSCIGVYETVYYNTSVWGYGPCGFVGTEENLPVEVVHGGVSIFCFHFADYKTYPRIEGPCNLRHNGIYHKHYVGGCSEI